jgi:uncharacterized coiled-coil DUF342 family protein
MDTMRVLTGVWRVSEAGIQIALGGLLGAATVGTLWIVASAAPAPSEAEELKREIAEIEGTRDAVQAEVEEARWELEELEESQESWKEGVRREQVAVDQLRSERDSLYAEIEKGEARLAEIDDVKEEAADHLRNVRAEIAAMGVELDEAHDAAAMSRNAVEERTKELQDALEETRETYTERVRTLQSELDEQAVELTLLRESVRPAVELMSEYRLFARDVVTMVYETVQEAPRTSLLVALLEAEQERVEVSDEDAGHRKMLEKIELMPASVLLEAVVRMGVATQHRDVWEQAERDAGYDVPRIIESNVLTLIKSMRENADQYRLAGHEDASKQKD